MLIHIQSYIQNKICHQIANKGWSTLHNSFQLLLETYKEINLDFSLESLCNYIIWKELSWVDPVVNIPSTRLSTVEIEALSFGLKLK